MTDNIQGKQPSIATALLLGLVSACFSVYSVLLSTPAAVVCTAGYLALVIVLSKEKAAWLRFFLPPILFLVFVGSVEVLFYLISLIVPCAICAFLFSKKGYLQVIAAASFVIAYAVCVILNGSALLSLYSLRALPVSIALALAFSKKLSRVSSICIISAILTVLVIIPYAIDAISSHGTDIKAYIEEMSKGFSESFGAFINELAAGLDEKVASQLDINALTGTAPFFFALIPALVLMITNILGFFIHYLAINIKKSIYGVLEAHDMAFVMSKPSAAVFLVCSLLSTFSLVGINDFSVFDIVIMSLEFILFPSFLLIGFASMATTVFSSPINKRGISGIFAIIIILYCGLFFVVPLALFGAFITLRRKNIRNINS